jgi:broad specificity phosphatase PhoE
MSASQEVMLVRHPQTVANAHGLYIGRNDSPLTEIGTEQVHWLARVVAAWEPDSAFSSPLGRALSTARAITPPGVRVSVLEELQEIDFGQAEGHTYAELAEHSIHFDYTSGGPIAPEAETGAGFIDRVMRAADLIESDGGPRTLVVTHGGVMRQLLAHWLGLEVPLAWRFAVPNGTMAIVRLAEGVGVLEVLTPPPDDPAHSSGRRRRLWHF